MKLARTESSVNLRHGLLLAVVFAAALAVPGAFALNPAEKPANYITAHWDTEDGLPHNSVKQLFQTRDGYLWIGTQQGLARFDGLSFTNFNRHNTPAFTSNSVTSMAQTSDGSLWIGTSAELIRHLDGKFTRYTKADGLKSTTINTVCVAPDGSLWIGGREGVVRWVGGKFVSDIDTSAYDTFGMRNITVDRQNAIWLAIGTGALRYKDGAFTAYGRDQGLPAQQLQMITADADGRIIAVTQQGLLRLEDGRFVPFEQNASLSSLRISRTLVDQAGNLWVGSVGGLDRWRDGQVVPYVDRYGNKLGVVDVVLEGQEGGLWAGTSEGLYRLTDRRATTLSQPDGVPGSLVLGVKQTRDGSLWVSSWGAGVTRFQAGMSTRFTAGSPLSNETVTCIYEAPDGTMWFGNRGSSLDRLADDKVTTYVLQSGVASSRPVTTLLADDDGTLLIGISNRGLLQLRDNQIVPVPEADELAKARATVWSIFRTAEGRLLLGTTLGLYQRRPDRSWVPVEFPTLKAPVIVRDFLEADGAMWLATDGHGLVRWKAGEARAYESRLGMVDDTLFSVLDDGQGAFWVSSARGLARIRKVEFAAIDRGSIESLNGITFGRIDGLLSASTSGNGSPSAIRLTDGRLMTATDKGVAVVDPRSLRVNKQLPTVVIEKVLVDDEPQPLGREIRIAAGSSKLEIQYTALSLIAPERVRFRYKLEGSDTNWSEAREGDRDAQYTHLAPGHYTFHVLASNNDGVWNETGTTLAVTMLPHYYQTFWFRLLAVIGLVSALVSLAWLRLRQLNHRQSELARRNAELDQRVEERTAELRRSQECGALEHARFKFIFDAVPVGITLASERLDGSKLRLINDAHLRICGLTRAQIDEPGIFKRISHPEDYPRQAVLMRQLEEGKIDHFSLEKRYLRPDGQIVWVVMNRLRLSHADGNLDYLTTIIDITARKQAERELAASYKNLVEVSRQAGMAEVATGVLHNVGNVLNSLNISASLIATGLRQSKAGSLAQLADLLAQHTADLASFLTADPKGKRVPEFLASLARHAVEERDRLLAETASLQQNVDHIKEIVAMQQACSTLVGISEPLEATSLIEDSLKMNAGSLLRHQVRVAREFSPVAPVLAERTKVLQILLNLICNAQHAAEAAPVIDKVITLGLEPGPGGRVRFVVRDNGVGIPPENLTRIFAHGFTTKATGHGFGLHSAANAAKEMKGSLTAHSEGPGTGATFVLELPAAEPIATPALSLAGAVARPRSRLPASAGRYTRPEHVATL